MEAGASGRWSHCARCQEDGGGGECALMSLLPLFIQSRLPAHVGAAYVYSGSPHPTYLI